jgi:YD repeat-containing protein
MPTPLEPGNNFVRTTLNFSDESFPDQTTTQYLDGFGKPLHTIRDNDGALLEQAQYDQYFRTTGVYAMGQGHTTMTYEPSPVPRTTTQVDEVGNTTVTTQSTDNTYFSVTRVTDPNGHTAVTYADGLGRTRKTVSGAGSTTQYDYDGLSRISKITNPVGEEFLYHYNAIDQLFQKKVPVASAQKIWWDVAYRPVATLDGKGNIQLFEYDKYNRITNVLLGTGTMSPSHPDTILAEGFLPATISDTLLVNHYEAGQTWLSQTDERILTAQGLGGWKTTKNLSIDDIGRPASIEEFYPQGKVSTTPTYTDAGLITKQILGIDGPESVSLQYDFSFDEILRPEETSLKVGSEAAKVISSLEYTPYDQVKTKFLGQVSSDEFLQKVDYFYDPIGRLIQINTPGQQECVTEDICAMEAVLEYRSSGGIFPDTCIDLSGILINGNLYDIDPSVNVVSDNISLADSIAAALDYFGLIGGVHQEDSLAVQTFIITLTVMSTNADSIALVFDDCSAPVYFSIIECCDTNEPAQGPGAPGGISDNDDLFFEELTYNYLDIARIEIGSDCSIGKMRNLYEYDGNHRVINMQNIVFDPDPIEDRYNTNYVYDLAGNITRLNRNGLITNGTSPTFGIIDSLIYDYDLNDPSKLLSVTDSVPDATAQPKGFVAEYSGYLYDANGNVVSDGGKGLTIQYNLLNLPDSIRQDTAGAMAFEYTYGGQKIRRNLTGDEEEDRVYLAGAEFKDGALEAFYHPEGRVVFEEDTLHYQYKIADHLGNTAVLFEDKDEDGLILTESSTSDSSLLEVLQRHYYYPFGMAMEGGWQDVAFPGNRYRYNGKELEGTVGVRLV